MDAVYVVGAGGIGCAVGYALQTAGVPVVFVETNPRKIVTGLREGLRAHQRPPLKARFVSFESWAPDHDATVLLCTKCYDNADVLAKLTPGIRVIPIQNGFDRVLCAWGHTFEGVASFVSECEPDRPCIRITRPGELHLGARGGGDRTDRPRDVIAALARSNLFRTVEVLKIEPYKHTKLWYNAAISPLAAAAGIDNGMLLSHPLARRLFFDLLEENYRILSAAGVELGRIGPFQPKTVASILKRRWLARALARAIEPSLRGTYCSMAGEIQKGRTEIDQYNGYLIRLARRTGTPCPLNQAVYDLVSQMAAQRFQPSPATWRLLAAA